MSRLRNHCNERLGGIRNITVATVLLAGMISLVLIGTEGCRKKADEPTVPQTTKPAAEPQALPGEVEGDVFKFRDPETGEIGRWGITGAVPEAFPEDIPLYPRSEVIEFREGPGKGLAKGMMALTLRTGDDTETVLYYYQGFVQGHGWQSLSSTRTIEEDIVNIVELRKEGRQILVIPEPSPDERSTLITYSVYPPSKAPF